MTEPAALLPFDQIERLYADVALSLGASAEEAALYSRCFATADLRHDTQGLPLWLEWALPMVEAGGARFGIPLNVTAQSAATLAVDGGGGVGQVVATRTMGRLIAMAAESGAAIGCIANGTDMAMTANYAMQALDHGYIGLAANTAGPASVAPWGGRSAAFGTNPFSLAVPSGAGAPIVIDMCCAAYSIGTLVEAGRAGLVTGAPVVAAADGSYSTDPASIISDLAAREPALLGAILPEGVRSAALLLMVELLAGLLSGNGTSRDQTDWSMVRPPRVGAFLCVIDIARFVPLARFEASVAAFADALRAMPPAEGFEAVRLPGDRAARLAAARRSAGIAVSARHWRMIEAVCARRGVALPSPVTGS
ncbi:Ldh family oxidoreductase [Sphingomonas flavalba]|uniref:Ldh family oxidoreductase n=1 Tax=Sphingomonas flavalba TaxID=2559804 RepID=UPI001445ED8E|nr:Ldh family oxidoreductase [Sphingomonas flavalba]